MYDLGFIDVSTEPHKLPPLPTGAVPTSKVVELVISSLEAAGATPRKIFTAYSEDPQIWNLPPRLMVVGRSECGFSFKLRGDPVQKYMDIHDRYRKKVKAHGMGPYIHGELVRELGERYGHPLAFTLTEPGEESANLYSLELILMLPGELKIWESNIFRFFKGKRDAFSKIRLNKSVSELMTAAWIQKMMTASRGTVLYPTYDIFDRCLQWVTDNLDKQASWKLRVGLSWLKAHQDYKLTYQFEQLVRHISPPDYAHLLQVEEDRSIFTFDTLNYVRDLWLEEGSDAHEAFRKFYGFLVPMYMDDDTFRRIFKTGMVLREDFNSDISMKIDMGLSGFESWFLSKVGT